MEDNQQAVIYIVRHGETEYNVQDIVQSQVDSSLTLKGQQQVRETAEILKNIRFDAIFSSDLGRAVQTAEVINLERKLAINTSRLLREKDFGIYDNIPAQVFREKIKHQLEKLKTLTEREKRRYKYHETWENEEEAATRMLIFLREVAVAYVGKTVLVVSHGSIVRSLLMHLGFATYDELPPGSVENAGFVVLQSDGADFFVKETKGINKVK
jgi:broad specificity phosphatase PhoE